MNDTQTKLRKTSRTIAVFLSIGKISSIVGIVLAGAGLVCGLIGRPDIQGWFMGVEKYAQAPGADVLLPMMIVATMAALLVAAALCHLLEQVFRGIGEDGTPFNPAHVSCIKRVAWLALALSVMVSVADNLEAALLTGERLVLLELDMAALLFAAIIYCLAYVFEYGCKLQQESDETL
ncbi:MAG: DUF2975 domain-containing protein [Eubacteriales bacterium]|nr:DUF2975 domain-containing protein [Eubacteriales bacterium]